MVWKWCSRSSTQISYNSQGPLKPLKDGLVLKDTDIWVAVRLHHCHTIVYTLFVDETFPDLPLHRCACQLRNMFNMSKQE